MKVLRGLALLIFACCILTTIILINQAINDSLWYIVLVLAQCAVSYGVAEITHTLWQKPKMPHPSSLAFQKEVIERYKV